MKKFYEHNKEVFNTQIKSMKTIFEHSHQYKAANGLVEIISIC